MDYLLFLSLASAAAYKSHGESETAHKTIGGVEGRKTGHDRYGGQVVTSRVQRDVYGDHTRVPQASSALIDPAYRGLTVPTTASFVRQHARNKTSVLSSMTDRRRRGADTDTLDKTVKTDRYGYKSHWFLKGGVMSPNSANVPQYNSKRALATYSHQGDRRFWENRTRR